MTPGPLLLVDDNPDDINLMLTALDESSLAAPVVVRRDGQEALEFLLGPPSVEPGWTRPSLIVLDLKMPRVGGLEVLREIRNASGLRDQRVMILTSSDETRDREDAARLAADHYVRKPLNFTEFLELARRIAALVRSA